MSRIRPLAAVAMAGFLALTGCGSTEPPPESEPLPSAGSSAAAGSSSPAPASAEPPSPAPRLTATALSSLLDANDLSDHLAEFQSIADEAGGNRALGTDGYLRSVEYVEAQLTGAGYQVQRLEFAVGNTTTWSVIAERAGSEGGVVVLGAHLDSVRAGPGINDNASGVAALLTIAIALTELPSPAATIRFAFWGAEENGPFGSQAYVDGLDDAAISEIRAYLNFDMIGSPNGVTFVYDERGAAPGSEAITNVVSGYFRQRGRPWEPIDLAGASDHGPFTAAGIPTGGLFAGGIEPVTDEQAARHGAEAGVPADACSHTACDTLDNVDVARLALMTDAIAATLVAIAAESPG